MNNRLTLVTGGARSGKSSYALKLAKSARKVLFVATAQAFDDDMAARIERHKEERPAHWQTLEAPLIADRESELAAFDGDLVIVDCLTLLTSNVMLAAGESADIDMLCSTIQPHVDSLLAAHKAYRANTVLVTNEVGLGIVPAYRSGRLYRDMLGRVNQHIAAVADEVVMMISGLPLMVKPQ